LTHTTGDITPSFLGMCEFACINPGFFRYIYSAGGDFQIFGRRAISKEMFVMGTDRESRAKSISELMWIHFVKYFIYSSRYKRTIPNINELIRDYEDFKHTVQKAGKWGGG
jgi:hypothetical protein